MKKWVPAAFMTIIGGAGSYVFFGMDEAIFNGPNLRKA